MDHRFILVAIFATFSISCFTTLGQLVPSDGTAKQDIQNGSAQLIYDVSKIRQDLEDFQEQLVHLKGSADAQLESVAAEKSSLNSKYEALRESSKLENERHASLEAKLANMTETIEDCKAQTAESDETKTFLKTNAAKLKDVRQKYEEVKKHCDWNSTELHDQNRVLKEKVSNLENLLTGIKKRNDELENMTKMPAGGNI
ncbi:hypothetical protein HDE_04116 [Halotydeus destructor]|nr:hypothetical protein HDE_04116 [Halotydeus destructor]